MARTSCSNCRRCAAFAAMRRACPAQRLPANVVVATGGKILHGTKDNIGPRVGFAYRVNDGMSVRGGFGITYDNWAAIIQMTQNYQGSWPDTGTLQINNTNTAGHALHFGAESLCPERRQSAGGNAVRIVERELHGRSAVEESLLGAVQLRHRAADSRAGRILVLNYVGSASHRMDVGGYYNTGTPCGRRACLVRARQTANDHGAAVSLHRAGKVVGPPGRERFLQRAAGDVPRQLPRADVHGRPTRGARRWMKAATDTSASKAAFLRIPYNPKGSRGPASFNIPQMFTANLYYELPIGVGKAFSTSNRLTDQVIGNWQVNGILTGRSGQNFNVTSAGDIAETGNAGTYERANLVGNPWVSGSVVCESVVHAVGGGHANRDSVVQPMRLHDAGERHTGQCGTQHPAGPGYWDLDTSVFRIFPITERMHLKAVIEAYNSLNHPVLGTPAYGDHHQFDFGRHHFHGEHGADSAGFGRSSVLVVELGLPLEWRGYSPRHFWRLLEFRKRWRRFLPLSSDSTRHPLAVCHRHRFFAPRCAVGKLVALQRASRISILYPGAVGSMYRPRRMRTGSTKCSCR